jgi:hypothetical protein
VVLPPTRISAYLPFSYDTTFQRIAPLGKFLYTPLPNSWNLKIVAIFLCLISKKTFLSERGGSNEKKRTFRRTWGAYSLACFECKI